MTPHRASPRRTTGAIALSLFLASCGGGGDGGCAMCGWPAAVASASAPPSADGPAPPPAAPPADTPSTEAPSPVATAPSSSTEAPAPGATPPTHVIGGYVTGLAANVELVLLDNNGDPLTLKADGAFRFAAPVAFNTPYAVTIGTQPLWQTCGVSNGSGTATADVGSVAVSCATAPATASTLAGSTASGSADGAGTAASFNGPQAITVDPGGNLYVADSNNHQIRKITPAGVVSTLAGSTTPGSADGTGAAARFNLPDGIAADADGNVYVADLNHRIRKITQAGVVTTLAGGTTAGSTDGSGAAALFNDPGGLAIDAGGTVYVADIGNHMIRKITPAGVVSTLAGSTTRGYAEGIGAAARFDTPVAVAVDAEGNVYVADAGNSVIRKITPAGAVSTLAGSGTPGATDGAGTAASFWSPNGLTVDASGHLAVADTGNHKFRRITPAGVVSTLAGSGTRGSADGIGIAAQFSAPYDVTVDRNGNFYAISGHAIRRIAPGP